MKHIKSLHDLILVTDFSIQSEALETMQELFLTKRNNDDFEVFVEKNAHEILDIFSHIQNLSLPEDTDSEDSFSESE